MCLEGKDYDLRRNKNKITRCQEKNKKLDIENFEKIYPFLGRKTLLRLEIDEHLIQPNKKIKTITKFKQPKSAKEIVFFLRNN